MGDPGGQPQQHRRVESLGQLIPQLGESQTFGGIAGLQHGHLGGDGVMAGILLVLGGMHPGIVRHGADHAAVHPYVGGGIKRVGRHVQPHVLHGAEAAGAAGGRAEGDLEGHLLVGGPLGIDIRAVLHHAFGDFGARRARVGGHDRDPRLVQAPGNRLVAQQQCFHGIILSWEYEKCGAAAQTLCPVLIFDADPPPAGPCR